MLKICTVLFVASICTSAFAQPTNQTELAEIFRGSAPASPDTTAAEPEAERVQTPGLAETCPQLAQLRTIDIETALYALYKANEFAPLWNEQQRLEALRNELAALADDGLSPADYSFSQQVSESPDICAELRTSSEYLLALEHLGSGRLDQQAHEPIWRHEDATPAPPPVDEWARKGLRNLNAAFEQARPDLGLYQDLRAAYIQLRDEPPEYQIIPPGDLVRPGEADPRVSLLAARLTGEDYLSEAQQKEETSAEETAPLLNPESEPEPATTLNPTLADALERFQENHGLKADGVLGPNTLAALNMPLEERLQIARINLERLRWISALLLNDALLVNNALNQLRHYQNDEIVWQTKIITGRAARETPLLVSQLDRITLNPDWTVPPTIRKEDMFPEIRKDLAYLKRKNLVVIDYQGNRLDPETINWNDPPGLMIRQPPGPDNPLGQVVFRFANPFAVYLHDTPDRHLFSRAQRNISSGCVRVEGADELADMLFSRMDTAKQKRVESLRSSNNTHQVAVADGPQIILSYWTAEADDQGRLILAQDPYRKDPALLKAFADMQSAPDAL